MPPTCDSVSRNSQPETESVKTSNAHLSYVDLDGIEDSGPFYGMFDKDDADVESEQWIRSAVSSSCRSVCDEAGATSMPGASETFLRAMRQVGNTDQQNGCRLPQVNDSGTANPPRKEGTVMGSTKGGRSSGTKVKKSASFSTSVLHFPSLSSSQSSATGTVEAASTAKRRMSVPCLRGNKHVQWVDEAGVSELVSVRLIRPRLAKGGDKEAEAQAAAAIPSRSILRRLSGMH